MNGPWARTTLVSSVMLAAAVWTNSFLLTSAGTSEFPLRDVTVDDTVDLSGKWLFAFDHANIGISNSWFSTEFDRSEWRVMDVPGVWFSRRGKIRYPIAAGRGWYYRKIRVPEDWTHTVKLWFLGSMHITDAWINGEYVGVHRGGYSPFSLDITDRLNPGTDTHIVIRVDNRITERTIPASNLHWANFGGIYREAFLVHQPAIRVEQLRVNTTVNPDGSSLLTVLGDLTNSGRKSYRGTVSATLLDKNRPVVSGSAEVEARNGAGTPFHISTTVRTPSLWSPEDPFLYTLRIEWTGGQNTIKLPVGIREIRMENGKMLLNNKRIWLQGFGLHEEYKKLGPCIPDDIRMNDLKLMKDTYNCNTVRLGHYCHHPSVYDMCDQLGLLVFTEIPAWQINAHFMDSERVWREWLRPMLTDMAVSLRNHPCVFAWGVCNETRECYAYFKKSIAYLRELDDTRFSAPVVDADYDPKSVDYGEFVARNFHYGWYHSPRVYGLKRGLRSVTGLVKDKPIWVAEIGGMGTRGKLSCYGDDSRGSTVYLDKTLRYGLQYSSTESEEIMGVSVWTWADFHHNNNTVTHGILTEGRLPKVPAYTVCNLFNGDLRVYVCEEDSTCRPGGSWKGSLRYFNPGEKQFAGVEGSWRIMQGTNIVSSGTVTFDVPGRRSDQIRTVEWPIPQEQLPGMYTFWIEITDQDGNWLYTNNSFFDVGRPAKPGVLHVKAQRNGQPVATAWAMLSGMRIPIYAFPGLILPMCEGSYSMDFHADDAEPVHKDITVETGRLTTLTIDLKKSNAKDMQE